MSEIRQWLGALGLEQFAEAFEAEQVLPQDIADLTEADLKDLGVPLGPRKRILKAASEGEHAPATAPSIEAERRQITVMFCDLAGSTALSERLDPEDLRSLMQAYQQACGAIIERYGGHVAQYLGDGLMTYFGWPTAHEDDAERAIRTALEIVHAVKGVAAPEPLQVRVGIATGPVVVGETGAGDASVPKLAVGETPNIAARLQALATADEVVVGETSRRLAGEAFAYDELGEQSLKGIVEPVRAYRALAEVAAGSRFEAYRGGSLTPLVGREEEIAFVAQRWQRVRAGDGQVVLLSGEAGIGKSRILEATREYVAGEGGKAIHFQCSPHHQSTALYAFTNYLAGVANAEDKIAALEVLALGSGLDPTATVPLLAELLLVSTEGRYAEPDIDPEQRRNLTLRALADHVVGLAQTTPLLAVFEDVHWIDPTSHDLLGLLLERSRSETLMILVTFRPEFVPPWTSLDNLAHLTLNRMTPKQTAELASQVLSDKALPPEVIEQIVARTDGVPLFVEELTKAIIDSDVLTETEDGYALSGPLPRMAVPETLQDSLMARLDRLAPVKEVAQIGAVIGREFGAELLGVVAGRDKADLDDALQQLAEAELIFRRGWPPDEVYVFKHALVQDAAYDSLLKQKRSRLHAAVSDALESRFPALVSAEPETVAYHLSRAGEDARAAHYWQVAGTDAAGRSAHVEACEHLEKAVALAPDDLDDGEALELHMALAGSLRVLGRSDDTLQALERAQRHAHEPADKARVHHLRGNTYFVMGETEKILLEQQTALAHARTAGSSDLEMHALSGMADAEYIRGHMLTAFGYFDDCVALARQHGSTSVEAGNLPAREHTRLLTAGPRATRASALASIAIVAEADHPRAEVIFRGATAAIFVELLEGEEALAQAETAIALCELIGARIWMPYELIAKARALWLLGNTAAAVEIGREAGTMAAKDSPALLGGWVFGGLAQIAQDRATAEAAMAEGERLMALGCVGHNQLWLYRDAIDACLRFADWDGAARCADALEAFTADEPFLWSDFFCRRARALVQWGRSKPTADLRETLTDLGNEARELGFMLAARDIDAALADG